jgi:type II secretory pathway predicted ATPase ExeA
MYESYFGLRQRPFRVTPDSECYYPATSHEQALAPLLQAIQEGEGLALLAGEPGTGKTLLGHCLLDRLGDEVTTALLTHSHFGDRIGLLQAVLYDLSLPHEGRHEQELRLALTDYLLKNYEAGRRCVLVLDEAQHLTPDLLEELRLLGNLEGRHGKALQIILLALPALEDTLRLPELAAFNQRLGVRTRLERLGLHEAADYVVYHLRAAGGVPEQIVSDEALEILARGTHGLPRLLNRAMDQALTLACAAGADQLDAEAALEALALLGLSDTAEEETEVRNAPVLVGQDSEDPAAEESDSVGRPRTASEPMVPPDPPLHPNLPKDPGRSRRLYASPRRPA